MSSRMKPRRSNRRAAFPCSAMHLQSSSRPR
jgi:hypothetical protein